MALTVNTNVTALNTQRNMNKSQSALNTSMQRLSSGLRINSAKDDAAGLAISDRFTSQIKGLNQAVRNANDGISIAQTAEGALQEVTSNLQRMRELAVQAGSDTLSTADRQSIQDEVDQLKSEIDRIATTTSFNGKNILDGSAKDVSIQVGANANQTISMSMVNARTNSLGSQAGVTQSTGARFTIVNGAADAGTRGIDDIDSTTVIASGDTLIKVDGMSSVNIAAAQFGGSITAVADTDALQNVNGVDYGKGIAKQVAERINTIREMQVEDTTAGIDGTYLENVYASAKTTFKASDITDIDSWAYTNVGGIDADDAYVGAGSLENGELNINGVDIGAVTFQEKDASGSLTTAINAKSDQTGVKASISETGELVLTAEDGRDIVLNVAAGVGDDLFAGGSGETIDATTAITDLRITGQVTITAQDTLTFSGATAGMVENGLATTDLDEDNVQAKGTIANADVSTVDGANTLLKSVDSALSQVDTMRGQLGAVQNRLTSTIANLQNVSENFSAASGRITDADFASETTDMTKNQILQQAGVAMLAQANQLPQTALSLLQ